MIDATLEEDLLEEFKGGTLSINPEDKSNVDKLLIKSESTDNKRDADKDPTKANINANYWSANFISPFASIPNKITATLWNTNKKPTNNKVPDNTNSIQTTLSLSENPNNYFTFRESVLVRALTECKEQFLDEESDGPLIEAFLLTQISNWNSDKERLLMLTTNSLVVVKYDFIALKRLGYKKLPLEIIDEVVVGDLIYPNGSLIPQMNGFVDGFSHVLETCLFARWSKSDNKQHGPIYRPSNRNMKGVRFIWNKERPLNFTTQWNPFNEEVPFCTFTYHPLFFHKDCVNEKLKDFYNLETFIEKLCKAISDLPRNNDPNQKSCTIEEKEIVLQNYLGIGSLIHNRNSLGFFKVRGKFSF